MKALILTHLTVKETKNIVEEMRNNLIEMNNSMTQLRHQMNLQDVHNAYASPHAASEEQMIATQTEMPPRPISIVRISNTHGTYICKLI